MRERYAQTVSSAKATKAFAASLAQRLKPPLVLLLSGPLGAGKTTFVQGFVAALAGGDGLVVQSPTYALMRTYATSPPVHHLDLYRLHERGNVGAGLNVEDELHALGIMDALDEGFSLIEWPADARFAVPVGTVRITPLSARKRTIDVEIPRASALHAFDA